MNPPDLLARCLGYAPQLFDGALTTLWLSAIAVACGFFAGVFIYLMSAGTSPPARTCRAHLRQRVPRHARARATAGLLLRAVGARPDLPRHRRRRDRPVAEHRGYQSQILGAGFAAIPRGQIDAAQTFNLTRQQRLWHIEIPQVVALTLPALVVRDDRHRQGVGRRLGDRRD